MKRLTLVVLASALLASAVWTLQPSAAERSKSAIDRAELDRVISVFAGRVAATGDPVNAVHLGSNLLTRAGLAGDLEDYRAARAAFELAVAASPSRTSLLGLANSAMALHDFRAALATASRLVELDHSDPAAHLLLGDAWLELGDIAQAVERYEVAAMSAPSDPAVVARRAEVAHLTGNQPLAIQLAEEADQLAAELDGPPRVRAFYPLLRADLLFDAGRYREAADQVARSLELSPGWAPAHASLGKVLAARGDLEGAEAAYMTALALQPEDPGWLASLADLALAGGEADRAAELYQQAEALYRADDPAISGQSLAALYADRAVEPSEAVRLASDDLARRASIASYDTLAWALFRAGDLEQAREPMEIALRHGTQDGELRFHAAMIMAGVGETDRAITLLENLLATNPQFHPVHSVTAFGLLERLSAS